MYVHGLQGLEAIKYGRLGLRTAVWLQTKVHDRGLGLRPRLYLLLCLWRQRLWGGIRGLLTHKVLTTSTPPYLPRHVDRGDAGQTDIRSAGAPLLSVPSSLGARSLLLDQHSTTRCLPTLDCAIQYRQLQAPCKDTSF